MKKYRVVFTRDKGYKIEYLWLFFFWRELNGWGYTDEKAAKSEIAYIINKKYHDSL